MASDEVIVAIALGLPSLIVAVLALWVAYLTFENSRPAAKYTHPRNPGRISSWPSPDHWSVAFSSTPAADYQLPAIPDNVR